MVKHLPDYRGRPVRLTDERVQHILQHPEMATMVGEVGRALKEPQEVRRSKTDSDVELAYRRYPATLIGEMWLCVVSKYSASAFVVTAYLTDVIKSGELLWPKK